MRFGQSIWGSWGWLGREAVALIAIVAIVVVIRAVLRRALAPEPAPINQQAALTAERLLSRQFMRGEITPLAYDRQLAVITEYASSTG